MLTKISKEFKWEMSHRLPFHKGLCRNLHGHSYKLRIDLEGSLDENGMLIDFFDLEIIMRPLLNEFDHAFLVDDEDTLMLEFLKTNQFKYLTIPFTSTSENIIKYIAERIIPEFKKTKSVNTVYIRLYETEDVFAEICEKIR
jgi:6-pyruvoyltetrahydropterin/6-carboxytetrahydropterin synthase